MNLLSPNERQKSAPRGQAIGKAICKSKSLPARVGDHYINDARCVRWDIAGERGATRDRDIVARQAVKCHASARRCFCADDGGWFWVGIAANTNVVKPRIKTGNAIRTIVKITDRWTA